MGPECAVRCLHIHTGRKPVPLTIGFAYLNNDM